jgi:hypothetical protein
VLWASHGSEDGREVSPERGKSGIGMRGLLDAELQEGHWVPGYVQASILVPEPGRAVRARAAAIANFPRGSSGGPA